MVHGIVAPSDEQEMQAIVREVDELRRARGLQQVGPWWQIERHGLFRRRRFRRASADDSLPSVGGDRNVGLGGPSGQTASTGPGPLQREE